MVLSNDMKKAIAFGLIIGAILSICNMCFAAETFDVDFIPSLAIDNNTNSVVSVSSSYGVAYFELEPGYLYHFYNPLSAAKAYCFSNDILSLGDSCNALVIESHETIDFTASDVKYVYFNANSNSTQTNYVLTREPLQGMSGFVDNLAYDLSYANLNGVVTFVIPIMAISILVALGFYLLTRLLNRIKKAKGGV